MPYKDKKAEQEYNKQRYQKDKDRIESPHHPLRKSWDQQKRKGQLCDDWLEFPVFCEWALKNGWKNGLVLMRENASKPFSPENCYYKETGDLRKDPLYRCWSSLKQNHQDEWCQEWLKYESFRDWALANGYQKGYQICRHDKAKQFFPDNCFYEPRCPKQDTANMLVNYKDKQITVKELSRSPECEVSYNTLCARITRYNIEPEYAIKKDYVKEIK